MTDYKAMYLLLFNAVTDALEKMDRQNYGEASALLIAAQQKAEELKGNDHERQGEVLKGLKIKGHNYKFKQK